MKSKLAVVAVISLLVVLLLPTAQAYAATEVDSKTSIMSSNQWNDPRLQWATNWAQNQVGSGNWNGYCEMFVEAAYGVSGKFASAHDAFQAIGVPADPALPGLIVFFQPNDSNGWYGHAGIYMGNDWMISATYYGVQWSRVSEWSKNIAPLEGFAYPPSDWPGIYGGR